MYESARAERIALARGTELKYQAVMTLEDLNRRKQRREREFDRAVEIDR
jgi:hypothetical protein